MDSVPVADSNSVASSVAAVRQAWLDAVRAGDVERLAAMVTDDVVVVHGNGRCVHGKDELKADFLKGFESFSIEQDVSSAEVVVRGRWAFEMPKSKAGSRQNAEANPRTFIPPRSSHSIGSRTGHGRSDVYLGCSIHL